VSRRVLRALVVVALALAGSGSARACIWDYDTIIEEKRGLPSLADAILGRYEVHSARYYELRRDRLEPKFKAGSLGADEWDDLAVAYERLGDHARAAELMVAKEARFPGLYTTQANWGTFLVHGGKLDEGLEHLKKAVAMNPSAHFGRERYQIQAIEFAIACKKDAKYAETHTILGPTLGSLLDEGGQLHRLRPAKLYERCPWIGEDVWAAIVGMLVLGGDPGEGWHEFYFELGELLVHMRLEGGFATSTKVGGPWFVGGEGAANLEPSDLAWFAFERAKERGSPRLEAIAHYEAQMREHLDPLIQNASTYGTLRKLARDWVQKYQAREREILDKGQDPHDESLWTEFREKEGIPTPLLAPRPVHFYELEWWTHDWHLFVLVVAPFLLLYASVRTVIVRWRRARRS
jgi:hypothetical protein